jgi:hypothetical protein
MSFPETILFLHFTLVPLSCPFHFLSLELSIPPFSRLHLLVMAYLRYHRPLTSTFSDEHHLRLYFLGEGERVTLSSTYRIRRTWCFIARRDVSSSPHSRSRRRAFRVKLVIHSTYFSSCIARSRWEHVYYSPSSVFAESLYDTHVASVY